MRPTKTRTRLAKLSVFVDRAGLPGRSDLGHDPKGRLQAAFVCRSCPSQRRNHDERARARHDSRRRSSCRSGHSSTARPTGTTLEAASALQTTSSLPCAGARSPALFRTNGNRVCIGHGPSQSWVCRDPPCHRTRQTRTLTATPFRPWCSLHFRLLVKTRKPTRRPTRKRKTTPRRPNASRRPHCHGHRLDRLQATKPALQAGRSSSGPT